MDVYTGRKGPYVGVSAGKRECPRGDSGMRVFS